MNTLLNFGQILSVHARVQPDAIGARDLERSMTFAQWNSRACRLANALLGMGLKPGDRVAVLSYNCVEWAEIYAATAKGGLIAVPINFRLVGSEVRYILEDSGAAAIIVQDQLRGVIDGIRDNLSIPPDRFIHCGSENCPAGYQGYEQLIAGGAERDPTVSVGPDDIWTLMYTSGTTGRPKGAIRCHRDMAMQSLMTEIELGLYRRDDALLVMPMHHANSFNFFTAFAYCGGSVTIFSRSSFDPALCLKTLAETGSTFTSLVPAQYIMLLDVPAAERSRLCFDQVEKLMISSAPARAGTKRAVMEMFPNSGLFELYGSTEASWVTMLHPHEQFDKLGSVGREVVGSRRVKMLDDEGREVPDGTPGELFSCSPYSFQGYWHNEEKTAEAFRGEYCTVGDIAVRDADGYISIVDRKKNVIISGGENIYPSEIEQVLATHENVKDVAVIGVADDKWGESVHAAVVLRGDASVSEDQLIAWLKSRIAGYKRPRGITFLRDEEMPRNATGKILHRVLRERIVGQRS